jgi:hypothetical protein
MEPQIFRVFNRTRPDSPSLDVAAIDTTVEPFKKLVANLAAQNGTGLWLNPYRGIPTLPGLPQFDLIYLDPDYRLLQEVETYPSTTVKPLHFQPSSALALPKHTIFAALALPGDQLAISLNGDVEHVREPLTDRTAGAVEERSADSPAKGPGGNLPVGP